MRALILAVALATVPASQSDSVTLAGSWTAEFDGQTFIRLEFRSVRGSLTGSLSMGDIEFSEPSRRRLGFPRSSMSRARLDGVMKARVNAASCSRSGAIFGLVLVVREI
jgi:hypothetical protein